jgi:D-cysteine desulfhydrase family pyridoxal phosphate-dependent enzyme
MFNRLEALLPTQPDHWTFASAVVAATNRAMNLDKLPRFPLAQLPTPIEELKSLSRELGGPDLLTKRDDQTGLALGGNKTRKLEFLVGQALEQGADTLVTAGAAQSNHCRQTAAAAAKAGLRSELLLDGAKPELANGNLLLDELLGANMHWIQRAERTAKLSELSDRLRKDGHKPYVIPVGGSNGIGATGYVLGMIELSGQLRAMDRRVDHVVFASSSGGTQAGITVGANVTGFTAKLHGISVDKDDRDQESYEHELVNIANETAAYIGWDAQFTTKDFNVVYGYVGGGYGVVNHLERNAIRLAASREGIILDPVYAGRAMGALIDLIRKKIFRHGETVLFWHTGGSPALFAYAKDLSHS